MTTLEIVIEQYSDGFAIKVLQNDNKFYSVSINQEDTVEELKDLFEILGFKTSFTDCY